MKNLVQSYGAPTGELYDSDESQVDIKEYKTIVIFLNQCQVPVRLLKKQKKRHAYILLLMR